jgi:hypothetical protein
MTVAYRALPWRRAGGRIPVRWMRRRDATDALADADRCCTSLRPPALARTLDGDGPRAPRGRRAHGRAFFETARARLQSPRTIRTERPPTPRRARASECRGATRTHRDVGGPAARAIRDDAAVELRSHVAFRARGPRPGDHILHEGPVGPAAVDWRTPHSCAHNTCGARREAAAPPRGETVSPSPAELGFAGRRHITRTFRRLVGTATKRFADLRVGGAGGRAAPLPAPPAPPHERR